MARERSQQGAVRRISPPANTHFLPLLIISVGVTSLSPGKLLSINSQQNSTSPQKEQPLQDCIAESRLLQRNGSRERPDCFLEKDSPHVMVS